MTVWSLRWLTAFALLSLFTSFTAAWINERPVLEVRDGNLFISSAKDRNITMQTLGASYVNVNGINLLNVATLAQKASQLVETWQRGSLASMERTVKDLKEIIEGPTGVLNRLLTLEYGTSSDSTTNRPNRIYPIRGTNIDSVARTRIQRLTARLNAAERKINRLKIRIDTDECASNPCQNGGTCEDLIDGYKCRCIAGWEGPQCNTDINECARYAGTDLGCQNGATCVNQPGTYRCICANHWFGLHCTQTSNNCSSPNSHELCGNGVCVSTATNPGYTCICDQGWETDGVNPACTKDVNECNANHPPCSVNPYVPCVNYPGSFACGGCPQGYTGNGYYCTDIDECAINNGGCSTSPSVQCINKPGTRDCGPCPSGYQGDGVRCTYLGACNINNGGCHRLATCLNDPRMSDWFIQCRCPAGYTGDGLGPNGCVLDNTPTESACNSNPCSHGICSPRGAYDYVCRCSSGYTGKRCDARTNPCDPNPCANGGTCSLSASRAAVCSCAPEFSGPRCGKHRGSCGTMIQEPSGSVHFPVTGSNYPPGLSCAWVLKTNASKVLNVTFTAFNLETSSNCQYDFLQVHDGTGAGEHMIGRYCGKELPNGGTIISSETSLYLWFHSDNSVNSDGFTFQWNTIDPLCGGEITAEHGAISSPGSPGKYPKDRDCSWIIRVTPGKRIQFHFFPMMIEESPNCTKDFLEIKEGPSVSDRQLALYCNHTHPPPLIVADDEAWIHFHSDSSGQDRGFQISFSTSEGEPGCGGVHTASSGSIASPNYHKDSYDSYLDCDWKIQLPRGERIQITWTNFDLENSRGCRFDSVAVYNGATREAPLIGKYCSSTIPQSIISESNVLLIRFKSDWTVSGKGFTLQYEVYCGGEFTEATGVIKSPYYPANYPGSRTCIYKVIQPPGKAIELTIQDMDIEGRDYPDCYFDSLEIRDGDTETYPLLGTYCGTNSSIPEFPILSTHNHMWLKFDTDFSIHKRGFMATYRTIDRRCGGIFRANTGIIQSVGPRYGGREDCTWIISAPPGFVVQLNWLTFDLESQSSCRFDYVQITENITREIQQDMGKYCGTTKPPVMTSQSQIVSIYFHTDDSVHRDGFMASYIFIDASKTCGGYRSSVTGVIKTPNYPDPYPANRECEWIINAPNKHQVVLNIKKFELEDQSSCIFDYLEIRNGGTNASPLLGKFCGTNIPALLKSFSNQMYLKFKSDSSRHRGGFEIEWDSSTIGCGGTLVSTSGSIYSPNYPQPYGHRAECNWRITVSAGSVIQFVFVALDLEGHSHCDYDFLEIREGADAHGKNLGRFCGNDHPLHLQTSSNTVSLRFRSDWSGSGSGFHLTYRAVCSNTLRDHRGVIESPNFPNNYPNRVNCSWIIEAPLGNKLNLTFSHFDLEAGSDNSCIYDYLKIREGEDNVPNKEINTYCDSTELPPKVVSNQRQVFVNFFSDSYSTSTGFRLEWVVNGCGGVLTKPQGTITSPRYPDPYPEDVDCEWAISVDYSHSIEVTFVDVHLEKIPGCAFDNVTLYNGGDSSAPKLIGLCHLDNNKPAVFTSTGNKLFFQFHADYSYANKGFKATYRSVNISCGGKFTTPTGIIHSTNYPINYPRNQYCEWLIEMPQNHLVNLTFMDFDIEDTSNCTDDYVRIYDGSSSNLPLLGSHCNGRPPLMSYVSTGNQLLVVMRTDSWVSAKGFKATYDMACGMRIVTNDQGIISMDSAVGLHKEMVNCTWTIIAQELDDHVTLTFTNMQINEMSFGLGDCSGISIQVFEGQSADGLSVGTWCNSTVPAPITSRGNALTIHAISAYGNLYDVKFSGTYSVLSSACGGNYTSEHGRISTPGYPDNYPRNIECVWNLRTSPGNSISLSFIEFDLIQSDNCDLDYLEVREENGAGKLIGVYCNPNPNAISASKSLWIKFKSSADGTKKGFVADYSLKHGNDLSGPSGEIASPLYPQPCTLEGYYYWRIEVDVTSSIQITFKDFNIETYYDECYVSLTIYDGYNSEAPELLSKCGFILPETVRSSSNVVYIMFSSSSLRVGSWFLLSWLQVPRESTEHPVPTPVGACDEIISMTGPDNSSYPIQSPGWPTGYNASLDCSWILESVPGTQLSLRFSVLDIEEAHSCMMDYVQVLTGNPLTSQQEWTEVGTYCLRNATSKAIGTSNLMKVIFHTDWSRNKTGFSATVRKVCGGQLIGPNGIIEFNGTTHTDSTGSWSVIECQWNVTAKPGKMIQVKFLQFDIQSTDASPCSDNYLMLKNGGSAMSPLLGAGKYCQNSIPETLQTTGNQLYVKTSGAKSKIRFKLQYSEVGLNCGGNIILTESVNSWNISTPNYPNIPPPHSECFWTIMAPAGEVISIHFTDRFDLTSTLYCNSEYLEIRDGATESSAFIGRYCGIQKPSSLTTTGNMMYLHFYTDVTDPKNGFQALVTFGDCGGIIRGKIGAFKSPKYPLPYPTNRTCGWHIIGPPGHTVKLQFQDIDLPERRPCESGDNVLIAESFPHNDTGIATPDFTDRVELQMLGQYCGNTNPGVIQSSGNEAIVLLSSKSTRFASDHRGFSINFTTSVEKCGGNFEDAAGEFSSPGYPNINMNNHRYCEWKIRAPEGYRIQVDILDIDLGGQSPTTKSPPQIWFYNDFNWRVRIKNLKASDTERRLMSTSNTMIVWYWSGITSHRGFKARYSRVAPALCGSAVTDDHGSLLSRQSALFNLAAFYCRWKFTSPSIDSSSQTLALTVSGVVSNNTGPMTADICRYKPANIVLTADNNKMIACLSGNLTRNVTIRSPLPVISMVILKSSWGKPVSNFTLDYRWHSCGGILSGPSHKVSAPKGITYPVDCAWHAKFPDNGEVITFTFKKLSLTSPSDKNYIIIRNGGPLAPQIGKYVGSIMPPPAESSKTAQSNQLWIEYHAEDSNSDFEIQLDSHQGGCGGLIHGLHSSEISSPGFPNQYPNNTECEWEIVVENAYHIGLVFVDRFNLETSPGCSNDFIQVFDWRRNLTTMDFSWYDMGKICGRDTPSPMNSTSNRMKILFRSNNAIRADGFRAVWNTNCGAVLDVLKRPRWMATPGWPVGYKGNLYCNFTFLAPEKEFIAEFKMFSLEGGTDCKYDNLTIKSANQYEDTVWCGENLPPIQRAHSRLELILRTDKYVQKRGFKIRYLLDVCGGEITEPSAIRSPSQDSSGNYHTRINCTWIVTAPPGKGIVLKFEKFQLEYSERCYFDYLTVYSGSIMNEKDRLAHLCGTLNASQAVIRSDNGSMVINFITDSSNNFAGFAANIVFTTGAAAGCGGEIQLSHLQTFRTQRGSMYESLEDCHWLIRAPNGYVVQLEITSMDLKNAASAMTENQSGSCSGDYIEIRDGGGPFSELIGIYCGTVIPPVITSSANTMWIRFVSDGTVNGNGVIATLKNLRSACGESMLLVTNQTKVLTSPGFSSAYQTGLNCRWLLGNSEQNNYGTSFTIHFIAFDLRDSANCTGDVLSISDKHTRNFVSEGFGQDFVFGGTSQRPRQRWMGSNVPQGIYSYCGSFLPHDYYSNGDEVEIRFKSSQQPGQSHSGFKLGYSNHTCNHNFTATQGRILHYHPNDCWFTITVPVGQTISLYFHEFTSFGDCSRSGLEVREGSFTGASLSRLCGATVPNPIFSTGNQLSLHSFSESMYLFYGYDITYTSTDKGRGCGGKIYNYAGVFTSPSFPGPYRNTTTCTWEITVPVGYAVELEFKTFDLGLRGTCETDFLEIVDILPNGDALATTTYCGEDNPANYHSNNGKVKVNYHTSVNNGGTGWSILFESRMHG